MYSVGKGRLVSDSSFTHIVVWDAVPYDRLIGQVVNPQDIATNHTHGGNPYWTPNMRYEEVKSSNTVIPVTVYTGLPESENREDRGNMYGFHAEAKKKNNTPTRKGYMVYDTPIVEDSSVQAETYRINLAGIYTPEGITVRVSRETYCAVKPQEEVPKLKRKYLGICPDSCAMKEFIVTFELLDSFMSYEEFAAVLGTINLAKFIDEVEDREDAKNGGCLVKRHLPTTEMLCDMLSVLNGRVYGLDFEYAAVTNQANVVYRADGELYFVEEHKNILYRTKIAKDIQATGFVVLAAYEDPEVEFRAYILGTLHTLVYIVEIDGEMQVIQEEKGVNSFLSWLKTLIHQYDGDTLAHMTYTEEDGIVIVTDCPKLLGALAYVEDIGELGDAYLYNLNDVVREFRANMMSAKIKVLRKGGRNKADWTWLPEGVTGCAKKGYAVTAYIDEPQVGLCLNVYKDLDAEHKFFSEVEKTTRKVEVIKEGTRLNVTQNWYFEGTENEYAALLDSEELKTFFKESGYEEYLVETREETEGATESE